MNGIVAGTSVVLPIATRLLASTSLGLIIFHTPRVVHAVLLCHLRVAVLPHDWHLSGSGAEPRLMAVGALLGLQIGWFGLLRPLGIEMQGFVAAFVLACAARLRRYRLFAQAPSEGRPIEGIGAVAMFVVAPLQTARASGVPPRSIFGSGFPARRKRRFRLYLRHESDRPSVAALGSRLGGRFGLRCSRGAIVAAAWPRPAASPIQVPESFSTVDTAAFREGSCASWEGMGEALPQVPTSTSVVAPAAARAGSGSASWAGSRRPRRSPYRIDGRRQMGFGDLTGLIGRGRA